jgi:hypothetical protein
MKCDKCGVTDNGTGDWAHVCGPVKVKKSGMNERIEKIVEQATSTLSVKKEGYRGKGYIEQVEYFDKVKFAELIISECAALAKSKSEYIQSMETDDRGDQMQIQSLAWQFEEFGYKIKKHFGIDQ